MVKLFNSLNNYLTYNDYKITIYKDKVHIINYEEIEDFSNNKISIKHQNGVTTINGLNLVISKMQDEEILIVGKIESIHL